MILEKYKDNIVFDFNPQTWSLREQAQGQSPYSLTGCTHCDHGIKTSGNDNGVQFQAKAAYNITDKTILIFADFSKGFVSQKRVLINGSSSTRSYDLYFTSTSSLGLFNGTIVSAVAYATQPKHMIGITSVSGEKWRGFRDGVFEAESNVAHTPVSTAQQMLIGGYTAAGFGFSTCYYRVVVLDVVLTDAEVAQAYDEEMNRVYVTGLAKKNFQYEPPIEDDPNLVAAYSMDLATGNLIDLTTNGNDAVSLTNVHQAPGKFGECLRFNGNSSIDLGEGIDLTNMSVVVWFKQDVAGADERIIAIGNKGGGETTYGLTLATGATVGSTGRLRILGDGINNYYTLATFNSRAWVHYGVTLNGATGDVYCYQNGVGQYIRTLTSYIKELRTTIGSKYDKTLGFTGKIAVIKIYSDIKDDAWMANDANKPVCTFLEDFSHYPYTISGLISSGYIGGWKVLSGNWTIRTDANNKNYLYCNGVGQLFYPLKDADQMTTSVLSTSGLPVIYKSAAGVTLQGYGNSSIYKIALTV